MENDKDKIKKLASELEKKIGNSQILNLKYLDQNFYMKREISKEKRENMPVEEKKPS